MDMAFKPLKQRVDTKGGYYLNTTMVSKYVPDIRYNMYFS